jgi:hypothetical protein
MATTIPLALTSTRYVLLSAQAGAHTLNPVQYDDIPVETSGDNVPEPVHEFNTEDIGERMAENLALCHYLKPTPVQKYSIPIGTVLAVVHGERGSRL